MMLLLAAKHIPSLFVRINPSHPHTTIYYSAKKNHVTQSPVAIERRYDIDWLRVILFGLLIPFHVAIGVYWSTYGTEINPKYFRR